MLYIPRSKRHIMRSSKEFPIMASVTPLGLHVPIRKQCKYSIFHQYLRATTAFIHSDALGGPFQRKKEACERFGSDPVFDDLPDLLTRYGHRIYPSSPIVHIGRPMRLPSKDEILQEFKGKPSSIVRTPALFFRSYYHGEGLSENGRECEELGRQVPRQGP